MEETRRGRGPLDAPAPKAETGQS